MRFTRYIRPRLREQTKRRLAIARKAVERDKDSVGLFPELARHQTAKQRLDDHDEASRQTVQRWRDVEAATWRRARRTLEAMNAEDRAKLLHQWRTVGYPGSASYLADIIWRFKHER